MRRNKLYTVNKGNLFALGDQMLNYQLSRPTVTQHIDWSDPVQKAAAIGTSQGLVGGFKGMAEAVNPFNSQSLNNFAGKDNAVGNPLSFKESFSKAGLTNGLKAGAGIGINAAAGLLGGLAYNGISGGFNAGGVGQGISSIGSTVGGAVGTVNPLAGAAVTFASNLVGGAINRAFGKKTDEAALQSNKEGINYFSNYTSNASNFDDIKGLQAMANFKNPYEGGWFVDVSDENDAMRKQFDDAKLFAENSLKNNIWNIGQDQINNAQREWYAYGGPLDFGGGALGLMQQNKYFDTIDKRSAALASKNAGMPTAFTGGARTYADGGLEATFLDSFGTDPIGAAVRYNQGLEQRAAQEEMRRMEAAKEAEYATMQQRLANLETQNQGLQALVAAQSVPQMIEPDIIEAPSTTTPSAATRSSRGSNSTWDYVENQLRKSGKFNDIQIEGIKYNLQRESSLNPDIVGDGGAAFGLGQWHGSRQPKDKSLEGQTKHLIETLSNFDGKEHWIGRGNYEGFMNARTPEEAHYYIAKGYERPRADIIAKVKRDSDMSLKKLNAFGGELGTNGTDFTNGLLYVDEGGSHEDNPFEGVPMGIDAEGIPNLVEEGETVYNDYVFSDRMMVPDFMYKELGLGGTIKRKGISFADASKKLAKESEQRPNDPLSQAGLEASLSKLAEVQETERMRKQAEEYMGLEYACGGKMKNKYEFGGDEFNPWGEWTSLGNRYWPAGIYKFKTDVTSRGLTPAQLKELAAQQIAEKKAAESAVSKPTAAKTYSGTDSNRAYGNEVANDPQAGGPYKMDYVPGLSVADINGAPKLPSEAENKALAEKFYRGLDQQVADAYAKEHPEGYDPYPTWMRYAPVAGLGAMALTDALGITNRPDYTMANRLEAAAQRAGYAPDVRYNPIGDYMRYNPMDRLFYANQLNGQSMALNRMLMNTSSPNKAANLLAAAYNQQLASGNLYRQGEEYNRAMYERTKEFNRKTNMFNSQMGLEAAMANARYRQAAQQLGLSGLGQAAAMRDAIDARVGATRSANLSNFLTSLGNIGRENFALNQINSDRSRQYGVYSNGVSEHKRSSKNKKGSRWT